MNHPLGPWEISIGREQLDSIRSDPRLGPLLTLARVINALRFCHLAVFSLDHADTPSNQRQRINAFLFTSGILYEGLKVAGVLGQYFGDRESFRGGLANVLSDSRTKRLQNDVLPHLRNKIVFHYDRDAAPEALSRLNRERVVFATGVGAKNGDVYYNLADELAVSHVLGDFSTGEEEQAYLRAMISDVTDVSIALADSAEQLIVDVIGDLCFEGRVL